MTAGTKLMLHVVVGFLAPIIVAAGQDTLAVSLFISLALGVAFNRRNLPNTFAE